MYIKKKFLNGDRCRNDMDKVSFVLVEHSSVVLQLLYGVADRPWLH